MKKNLNISVSTTLQQQPTATLPAEFLKVIAGGYVRSLEEGTTEDVLSAYSRSINNAGSVAEAIKLSEEFILQRTIIDAVKFDNWMPFEEPEVLNKV